MQSHWFTYYYRVIVSDLIGSHRVERLQEASVLLRIIEKIRLTDAETIESNFKNNGAQMTWNLPTPGYGDILVELENEEAGALATVIESARGVRVADADWLMKVRDKLKPPKTVEPVAHRSDSNACSVS